MNKDYYISLLIKKWKGELSSEEGKKLTAWLNDSTDNRDLSTEMYKTWEAGDEYALPFSIHENEAFDTVWKKLHQNKEEKKHTRTISLHPVWSTVAASVAILLMATWYLFIKKEAIPMQTALADIEINQIHLPDGSKVWLRPGSKLIYPEKFNTKERRVVLEGEAFFDVQRNIQKPFKIQTKEATVSVLGTSFTVSAFAQNKNLEVAVETGKVRLLSNKSNEHIDIEAKQRGILNIRQNQFNIIEDQNLNTLAWKRHRLIFRDTPLRQVLDDLQTFYNIKIDLNNTSIAKCPFTGRFDTSRQVGDLLIEIADIFKMEKTISPNNGVYIIKGGNCQ